MTTTKRTFAILTATTLCAVLALPFVSNAEDKALPSIEALAEQSATTAAHHEALAAHYRAKAEEARGEVTEHRQMALSFPSKGATGMQAHCNELADSAQKAATAYDAMAAFHDEEAKKAGK